MQSNMLQNHGIAYAKKVKWFIQYDNSFFLQHHYDFGVEGQKSCSKVFDEVKEHIIHLNRL